MSGIRRATLVIVYPGTLAVEDEVHLERDVERVSRTLPCIGWRPTEVLLEVPGQLCLVER